MRQCYHTIIVVFIFVFGVPAWGGPAPASDVDWSDSGPDWVSETVTFSTSGIATPHVVNSRFQIGLATYQVTASTWDESLDQWRTTIAVDALDQPPYAEVEADGNGRLHIAYIDDVLLQWCHFEPWVGGGGCVAGALGAPEATQRPAVANMSDELPAIAYFDNDPLNLGTFVVKVQGGFFGASEKVPDCDDGQPAIELFPDDRAQVACLHGGAQEVTYAYDDGMVWQPERVFPDGPPNGERWTAVDMTIDPGGFGAQHVVAFNSTLGEVWHAERTAAGGWVRTLVSADGPAVVYESVSVSVSTGGLVGVALQTADQIQYIERIVPGGAFLNRTRVDGGSPPGWGTCDWLEAPVHVRMLSDETVQVAWGTMDSLHNAPPHAAVEIARYTQWDRPPAPSYDTPPLISHPGSSLALDDATDPWTCYYAESSFAPPRIDLHVRYRDDPPMAIGWDVALPAYFNHGCDVAVAADGTVGVLYADNVAGTLRYDARPPGLPVFLPQPNLRHAAAGDPDFAAEHVALAFDANSEAGAAYATGAWPSLLRYAQLVNGAWQYVIPDNRPDVGYYLDLDFDAVDELYPRISYYGDGAAWVAEWATAVWSVQQASPGNAGYDTSIASRVVAGTEVVAVSYYNFGTGAVEVVQQLPGGGWGPPQEIEGDGNGEFTSVAIDAFGFPLVTYRGWQAAPGGTGALRVARWSPFAGGRIDPAPPVGAYVRCSPQAGGLGTSLAPDDYDNWRVSHKEEFFSPPQIGIDEDHTLHYLSRP